MFLGLAVQTAMPEGLKTIMEYTRKQLIEDCVKAYIRNNNREWIAFLQLMNQKRLSATDKNFAVVTDDLKSDSQMRQIFSIPEKLLDTIDTMLKAHQEPELWSTTKEKVWFKKTFPEFSIARLNNFDSNEPKT